MALRSIFITGGGSGIGRATALHFAAKGWFVGVADISEAGMAETLSLIPGEAKWAERMGKLRKIILTPSLIIVWVLGLSMAYSGGWFASGWLHAKLTLVVAMTGYHGWLVGKTKKMARGERPLSEKTLRMIGEVPGVLLILIVLLVYLKPF